MSVGVTVTPVAGIPEVEPGADLAALLAPRLAALDARDDDILVVAHKIVSKAEGRFAVLADVRPGPEALALAAQLDREPRHVQVILDESSAVVRAQRGVLITRTHHGFVCANAGVDGSNVPGDGRLLLLPRDPDASARALRAGLRARGMAAPAVLVTDSFGRAWRHGQVDVAIGLAGLAPLDDWRGRTDTQGRTLEATWIAVADQVAAAADLVRAKDGASPVALVRGLAAHVRPDDGPGIGGVVRPPAEDLFT